MVLAVSAINQALIDAGLRLRVSVIAESGQISSSHHVAAVLGFGASAVYPLAVQLRAEETLRRSRAPTARSTGSARPRRRP